MASRGVARRASDTGSGRGADRPNPQQSAHPRRWTMATPGTFTTPNLYQLEGGGIHVTYSTGGFGSKLNFTYQDANGSRSFSRDQINVTQTPIGSVVTVTIRQTVDTGSTSVSVLIPTVNLTGPGQDAHVVTEGITTIHRFSVILAFDRGQTELYQFTPLSGTANQVVF